MPKYNLVDERWIPVVMLDESFHSVSLIELFSNWEEIRDVEANTLLRDPVLNLLKCITLHAIEKDSTTNWPSTYAEWKEFEEQLDSSIIIDYLQKNKDAFYLLHEERPFMQVTLDEWKSWVAKKSKKCDKVIEKKLENWIKPWTTMSNYHTSSSQRTWHDHTLDDEAESIPYAEAALYLLNYIYWDRRCGPTPSGNNGAGGINTDVLTARIVRDNLRESVLFDVGTEKCHESSPYGSCTVGEPAWCKTRQHLFEANASTGLLDALTLQTRFVTMIPNESHDGIKSILTCLGVTHAYGQLTPISTVTGKNKDEKNMPIRIMDATPWYNAASAINTVVASRISAKKTNIIYPAGINLACDIEEYDDNPTIHIRYTGVKIGDKNGGNIASICDTSLLISTKYIRQSTEDKPENHVGKVIVKAFNVLSNGFKAIEDGLRVIEIGRGHSGKKMSFNFTSARQSYWAKLEHPFYKLISSANADEEEWKAKVKTSVEEVVDELVSQIETKTLCCIQAKNTASRKINTIISNTYRKEEKTDEQVQHA